jgi:hypothetical protein
VGKKIILLNYYTFMEFINFECEIHVPSILAFTFTRRIFDESESTLCCHHMAHTFAWSMLILSVAGHFHPYTTGHLYKFSRIRTANSWFAGHIQSTDPP